MGFRLPPLGCAVMLFCVAAQPCWGVRVMTDPATEFGDPSLQFDNIALTPDGTKIVATAQFSAAAVGDRVYSLNLPADPATTTATLTQLSTNSFLVSNYDVGFSPVISPNGQTVLFTHDGNSPRTDSIYTMPITGEGSGPFTGLFGADPNLVGPGYANRNPVYSPDGGTIFFINQNAAFGDASSIPNFAGSVSTPFADAPDWDQLYSVPSAGGTPTPVTLAAHGDIDSNLFAVTPNGASIIYAPDAPIATPANRGSMRPKLYAIPAAGGASTAIPLAAPAHDFSITGQLALTPDGASVLFLADYLSLGVNEVFSLPISGGIPTRISDNLAFGGDVTSFAISPDGASVAYAAGQNTSANNELFLTPLAGGVGASIRISDPLPSNSGVYDVSTVSGPGQVVFSPDSAQVYYLGDLTTDGVNDLYVVDTTEKVGLIPSVFRFVGPNNGDFFDELNWQDAQGAAAPADTINPGVPIRHSLLIDGKTVSSSGGEADFQVGGSLELTPGSALNFLGAADTLDFNPGAALKLSGATIVVGDDIFLEGTNLLTGGTIQSLNDDVEFPDGHKSAISGTTFLAGDSLIFDNSATSISGATFTASSRIGMRYEVDLTFTDSAISLGTGLGDVEDVFVGDAGEGSTLTLKGASTLLASTIDDGIDLVLDGTSVATLIGRVSANTTTNPSHVVGNGVGSFITFLSTGARLVVANPSDFDPREFIINGLTGLSYAQDPLAWTVTNWNGLDALPSLQLAPSGLPGDYNGDGAVDAADYTVWRDNLDLAVTLPNDTTPGSVTTADYQVWKDHFGTLSPALGGPALAGLEVPEPSGAAILVVSAGWLCVRPQRRRQRAPA